MWSEHGNVSSTFHCEVNPKWTGKEYSALILYFWLGLSEIRIKDVIFLRGEVVCVGTCLHVDAGWRCLIESGSARGHGTQVGKGDQKANWCSKVHSNKTSLSIENQWRTRSSWSEQTIACPTTFSTPTIWPYLLHSDGEFKTQTFLRYTYPYVLQSHIHIITSGTFHCFVWKIGHCLGVVEASLWRWVSLQVTAQVNLPFVCRF